MGSALLTWGSASWGNCCQWRRRSLRFSVLPRWVWRRCGAAQLLAITVAVGPLGMHKPEPGSAPYGVSDVVGAAPVPEPSSEIAHLDGRSRVGLALFCVDFQSAVALRVPDYSSGQAKRHVGTREVSR